MAKNYTLVVNPGSASRKYALFDGDKLRASLYFEYIDGKPVGSLSFLDLKHEISCNNDLTSAIQYVIPAFQKYSAIEDQGDIAAIGIRLVAPSEQFMKDTLVTDEIIEQLEKIEEIIPLHISAVLSEIKQIKEYISMVPIIAVSDSAFHASKPRVACHYAIDTNMYKNGIRRYGYHGISVESVIQRLKSLDLLKHRVVVCHLGSGCSVTAVRAGESFDNSMGYSPLEGLMMSTRSGSIDVAASMLIKRKFNMSDEELEQYLNKKSGLLGVSGKSDDIRQLTELEDKGDDRAALALDMYVYRIQQTIGQMAVGMGGIGALVFTGTVGERSFIIRERVMANLNFLGFRMDKKVNGSTYEPDGVANIAMKTSKPIYVISTDEAFEIAHRAERLVKILS